VEFWSTNTYLKVKWQALDFESMCCGRLTLHQISEWSRPRAWKLIRPAPLSIDRAVGHYTITIPSPSTQLAAVKDFFKATYVYTNLTGRRSARRDGIF